MMMACVKGDECDRDWLARRAGELVKVEVDSKERVTHIEMNDRWFFKEEWSRRSDDDDRWKAAGGGEPRSNYSSQIYR